MNVSDLYKNWLINRLYQTKPKQNLQELMQEYYKQDSETLRNKFLSLPSRSESRFVNFKILKSSRNTKQSQVAKEIQQKIRQRCLPLLRSYKTFTSQKEEAQNDLYTSQTFRTNPKLQNLLKKLHMTLIHSRIPDFYGFYFFKRLKDVKQSNLEDVINKEISWIKERQCHYSLIEPTVKAREGCLKQLSRSLQNLQNDSAEDSAYREFREEIIHYRRLTTLAIKQIKQWKDYLINLSEKEFEDHPAFIYLEEDYFLTLLNDNMFLFNSFLSKYVNFSQKNDPFLLKPHANRLKVEKYAALFAVGEQEKKQYIGLLDYLAEQRAKYLKNKVMIKGERMKNIEKIYLRNNIESSKSQLFVARPNKTLASDQIPYFHVKDEMNLLDDLQRDSKKSEIQHKQKKLQQIRRRKQMISTSHNMPMMSNKWSMINQTQQKTSIPIMSKTLISSPINIQVSETDYDEDFLRMMRKKQVLVLKDAKEIKNFQWKLHRNQSNYSNYATPLIRMSRSSSFRTIKIKDSLSKERRTLNNKSCLNQLESIVSNLETIVPMELSRFKLNLKPVEHEYKTESFSKVGELSQKIPESPSPKKLKKLDHPTTSLIRHNDEVMLEMRNRILKEIEYEKPHNSQIQITKQIQNQRVQAILQQKIQKQVLRYVNQEKHKRQEGRAEMVRDFNQEDLFGQSSRISDSKRLTQLEQELKKEFQLRLLREVHSELKRKTELSDIELYKMQQQEIIALQAKRLTEKQERQKRFLQIQKEQRAKAFKQRLELQAKRKKELEQEMERIIQEEKQKLEIFTLSTSKGVKDEMKQQVKENMLKQLQYEKDIYLQNKLTLDQTKLREDQYRQQVKRKLIQQYEIQEIVERQHQRQEKQKKQKMIEHKFEHFDQIISKNNSKSPQQKFQNELSSNDKVIIQTHLQTVTMEEARQKLIQKKSLPHQSSQIQKYKRMQESQKIKMRQEFEVELFSFVKDERLNIPQTQKQFKVKNIEFVTQDPQFLEKKQRHLKKQIESIHKKEEEIFYTEEKQNTQHLENLKGAQNTKNKIEPIEKQPETIINLAKDSTPAPLVLNKLKRAETESSMFEKFSQSMTLQELKHQTYQKIDLQNNQQCLLNVPEISPESEERSRLKLKMTVQEFQIYKKRKNVMSKNRKSSEPSAKKQKYIKQKKTLKKEVNQFELIQFSQISDQQNTIEQNKNNDSVLEQGTRSQKEKSNQKKVFVFSNKTEAKQQTRGRIRRSRKSQNENEIPEYPTTQFLIEEIKTESNIDFDRLDSQSKIMRQNIHSQFNNSAFKRKNKFMTSGEEGDFQEGRDFRERRSQRAMKKQFHERNKKKEATNQSSSSQSEIADLIEKQIARKKQSRLKEMFVNVRKIKNQKIEQFMRDHFEHTPRLIKRLNLYKRDELVKLLRQDYKFFTILEYVQNNVSLGLGIASLNQKKNSLRSFNIFHIGPYDENDLLKLLKNFSEYLFKNDPVEEITLSLFYYSDVEDQMQFIKKFQKEFSNLGVMFQKNIYDTQFERKLVIRKTLGQKGFQQKENVNCGIFWIQNDLVVAEKQVGLETTLMQKSGDDFGCYGILSIHLALNITEEQLKKVIEQQQQNGNVKNQNMKHLAKQSLVFQPSIQKICEGQSFKRRKFGNAFEMNLDLHKLGRPMVKCQPEFQDEPICCTWQNLHIQLELNYSFTNQKMNFMFQDDEYVGDYLRFIPNKTSKKKTYSIKSKLYSSSITVMPCKNSRYKVFVLSSEEYDNILKEKRQSEEDKINLDIYIKLFFANILVHEVSEPESIWLPQFKSKREYVCQQIMKHFQPSSESTLKSFMDYSYTSYLENSLIFETSHRDLVITPPFILGVIDSQMQLAAQGACLIVKKFGLQDILGLKDVQKIIDED